MSSLARAKHPKMILGAVGTAIAIPVLGITISFVSVSANTQQNTSAQQEATETVVASPSPTAPIELADPKPAQSPLPDPFAPEPSTTTPSPTPEAVTVPTPVASTEPSVKKTPDATPSPISTVKASKSTDAQDVQAPRVVKKETDVARSWTPPVLNPGTVSLRAPKLTSGVKVGVTVACSPSVNCVINGDQLTFSEATRVTVTYSAKATSTHKAWSTTISN